ncbi:protein eyes shut homolog isoform X3 [Scyliorhinus canicula]|uniref:protein eyes shut homolog isoform X3 n=1 Tax=Scyliorhinus canicula TaxID=7830 RepID=UPI0018F66182|nr:protein eyes shut homolog isoform X3 [Scyliorhinus canicula]
MTARAGAHMIRTTTILFHVITAVSVWHSSPNWKVSGQTICQREKVTEWQPDLQNVYVNWTLAQNVCSEFYTECWGFSTQNISPGNPVVNLAQNCPLDLQLGVNVYISLDPSFEKRGMIVANASEAEFTDCTNRGFSSAQLLFGGRAKGTQQIDPKWLTAGTHYLVEVQDEGPPLCRLGLRLNVTVKPEHCRAFNNATFCSGHGKCQTEPLQAAYFCHCQHPYTGFLCEEYDACSVRPCLNGGICADKKEGLDGQRYDCACPPQYTGDNCSEMIGQCKPHICIHGNCSNMTLNTFVCVCDREYKGSLCEELVRSCDLLPCLNGGVCRNTMPGYACDCPAGFTGHNCEINVNKCSLKLCLNGGTCLDGINNFVCTCMPEFTGERCENRVGPCDSSPCVNNGDCVQMAMNYYCRCSPGFTGRNCEAAIDYCHLLSINCFNSGLCLNLKDGYTCLCVPGWTGRLCQHVENACLIHPSHCQNGATCVDISKSDQVPQYKCRCPSGYTGVLCETEVDECSSNPCKHRGLCNDYVGHYDCSCPVGFEGMNCEVDLDACTILNVTCPRGLHCVDRPADLEYACLTPCSRNPCANGGRCFLSEGMRRVCVCTAGWTGRRCTLNRDECWDHWCQNGGSCEDGINAYRCICPPGHTGELCDIKVDHCIENLCTDHGTCRDQEYNYTCQCATGYEGSYCQLETNECENSPCENGAACTDLLGRFSCQCVAGFTGITCSLNIDECYHEPCLHGGTCIDGVSQFECICRNGFSGSFCEMEENECKSEPCQNGAVCRNEFNMYNCFCPEGFEGLNCEINSDDCSYGFCDNQSTCLDLVADYICLCPLGFTDKNCSTDIDECASDPCKNGATCVNVIGEYSCGCAQGFESSDCSVEINECLSNPCVPTNTVYCEDLTNSFRCICQHGYMGEICAIPVTSCVAGLCQNGSQCEDIPGGFRCHCIQGLEGRFCEVNINECENGPCGDLSICKDDLNYFSCYCAPGFVGNNCEIEVDECLSDPCQNNGVCTDLLNSFSCVCPDGIEGIHCEINRNECHSSPCLHNATCIDLINSYICICLAGFTGFNCESKPCEASNPCENGGACVEERDLNTYPLGFRCACTRGYAGPRCESNINDCSTSPCLHGFCYDVVNGFYCLCSPGFAGMRCDQNINDCINNSCENNSTCMDFHLSYQCACLPGWEGDFCERGVNECASEPCENNATCEDLVNGYRCMCTPGWRGSTCTEDVNECDSNPCRDGATCFEPAVPGKFECICPPFFIGDLCEQPYDPCDFPYNPCRSNSTCVTQSNGTVLCSCQLGFEGARCEIDSNECLSSPCQNRGRCWDEVNSYRCLCLPGFSGTHCETNINECSSGPCRNNATCLDLENQFQCNCEMGYSGALCELDVNECELLPCRHNGSCYNVPGGYQCLCSHGFTGLRCEVNINDCAAAPCYNKGTCIDAISGYSCICLKGFAGMKCEHNVDECASNPCLHGICTDSVDGFECHCESGWMGSKCDTDVEECNSNPCLNGGICQELVDAYKCLCPDGYAGENCQADLDVCKDDTLNFSRCLNDGACVDGPGTDFSCRCLPGFSGQFCEEEIDECRSGPCCNYGLCLDYVNGYLCTCTRGWTGTNCQVDIDECQLNPCVYGICVQNTPLPGYSCFCIPGFVGVNCEQNYNDCFIYACPVGSECVDGLNNVTCLPAEPTISTKSSVMATAAGTFHLVPTMVPAVPWSVVSQEAEEAQSNSSHLEDAWPSIISSSAHGPAISLTTVSIAMVVSCADDPCPNGATCEDLDIGKVKCHCSSPHGGENCKADYRFSYAKYHGNSHLEFGGFRLLARNNILVRFQTYSSDGTLIYTQQSYGTAVFFIKLYIEQGFLQFQFFCESSEEANHINTTVRVDDGRTYVTQIRQDVVPCNAVVTVFGVTVATSTPGNTSSRLVNQRTGPLFLGGLPTSYRPNQVAEPFNSFTGCLEIMKINGWGPFVLSNAISRNNIDYCRFPSTNTLQPAGSTSQTVLADFATYPGMSPSAFPVLPAHIPPPKASNCQADVCQNGGTCHDIWLPSGAASLQCDCPLHFAGRFCEKDITLFFPSFNGNAYIELPSLTTILRRDTGIDTGIDIGTRGDTEVMMYLTIKTASSTGTILYSAEENFGSRFLHLFLLDGKPTVKLGCGRTQEALMVSANQRINVDQLTSVTVRYLLPPTNQGGDCVIEVEVAGDVPIQRREFCPQHMSQGSFGPIYLGASPVDTDILRGMGHVQSYIGCIRELQVNDNELSILEEAVRGKNIVNCDVSTCDYHPCKNGATCISDTESWFCECPRLYSGKLCQFAGCEGNPCGHGATCVPKASGDPVCLCPYGRSGILCDDAVNITYPLFSGTDEFGFTSFLAYSTIQNISFSYEFRLKFTLADGHAATKDNLIVFTGQNGHGSNGDDFLMLGLRNGSVVYSFNLGSGTTVLISEPLDRLLKVHVIHFGRFLKTGWLKVDNQGNKTSTSNGTLTGLNVLSQIYVGGYREYIPELLPNGTHFSDGFQGCIYKFQVRAGKDRVFRAPGIPEGHPNAGRSVGQCGDTPCSRVKCRNGGTCVEKASTVYCRCAPGWKGAFCMEIITVCDPEHKPPHQCAPGASCIPLPEGYICRCPLGTTGIHCKKALNISDPSFRTNESSWMAFGSFNVRHKTHIRLQFLPRSPDGILFYTAQHLSPRSGDFLSIALVHGFVQLRYNLGDVTVTLQTAKEVDRSGRTWHLVEAGRSGNQGYLALDGVSVTRLTRVGMTALDTKTPFFVGGVPSLNDVNAMAVEDEPMGFDGCVREVVVNDSEFELTAKGAEDGSNVGDCDGTICGYKTCENGGNCSVVSANTISCTCPALWAGTSCEISLFCLKHRCDGDSLCMPDPASASYSCACPLGRAGVHCERRITLSTANFTGNSYIKYRDPLYLKRDLRFTSISLNFTTSEIEGLVLWMGRAENEDNDYLAIGVSNGHLKIVVNLGERLALPFIFHNTSLCCNRWHFVSIHHNQTVVMVQHNGEWILFEDLDPQKRYVALNYGGICYFGGFELPRKVKNVTDGLFTQGLVGQIKDIFLFKDPRQVQFSNNAEGYNILSGNEG